MASRKAGKRSRYLCAAERHFTCRKRRGFLLCWPQNHWIINQIWAIIHRALVYCGRARQTGLSRLSLWPFPAPRRLYEGRKESGSSAGANCCRSVWLQFAQPVRAGAKLLAGVVTFANVSRPALSRTLRMRSLRQFSASNRQLSRLDGPHQ